MTEEIVRADRTTRITVVVIVIVVMVIVGFLFQWGLPRLVFHLKTLPAEEAVQTIKIGLVVTFGSVIPIGLYMFVIGRRTSREERFPPRGLKVLRDTKIISGPSAVRRGRVIQALGALLMITAAASATYAYYTFPKIWVW
ncbi:MAG: hypothetical protein HQK55_07895 [Deltaproteobacteria bacterium]|nr:hypothetical protein [Deltaproteobacteria bacterium]